MNAGTIIQCIQGSPEWFEARIGEPTASRMSDVFAFSKRDGKELEARRNYKIQLATEMLTGRIVENWVSADMIEGQRREPLARAAYEEQCGVEVELVGYVTHPTIARSGCSPDGLVGPDGLVEFKGPRMTTHTQYLLLDRPPDDYLLQMTWQMACTGRRWCDFVSYDPRFGDGLDLCIRRLERDNDVIHMMEEGVVRFLAEVDELLEQLRGPKPPALEVVAAQEKLTKQRKQPKQAMKRLAEV